MELVRRRFFRDMVFLWRSGFCRRLILRLSALVWLFPVISLGQPPRGGNAGTSPADQAIKNALAAENAGQLQQAEVALQELVKRYPDNFATGGGPGRKKSRDTNQSGTCADANGPAQTRS